MSATAFISNLEVGNSIKIEQMIFVMFLNKTYENFKFLKQTRLTCLHNSINEFLTRNKIVIVLINFSEQVHHSRFLIVHEPQELQTYNMFYNVKIT